MIAAAFDRSPAVLCTFSWGDECIILSGEMSRPDEGAFRATRFRPDGPCGHVSRDTREKLVSYLADDYPEACRAMTEAEVMAFTSTQRFVEGCARVYATQDMNRVPPLAARQ
jgi:hypothetical protein